MRPGTFARMVRTKAIGLTSSAHVHTVQTARGDQKHECAVCLHSAP